MEKALDETIVMRLSRKYRIRERVSRPYLETVAKGMAGSRILAFADQVRQAALLTRTRFVGIVGLLFALYTLAGFFLRQYFSFTYSQTSVGDLILGSIVLLGSIPLLFVGKPIGAVLAESRLFGRVCIGVFGIDPYSLRPSVYADSASTHGALAFTLGTVLGVAGIFLYPHRIAVWLVQLLLFMVILAVPEAGLMGAVIALPLAPVSMTAAWAGAGLFSYIVKVLRLKRTFRMRVPEAMMLLMLLSVFLTTRTGGGANETFYSYLLFGTIWVLTVNLIKTGTLFRKYIAAMMYGGILTLAITGARFLLNALRLEEWAERVPGETLQVGMIGIYAAVLIPLILLHGKRWSGLLALILIAMNAYFLQSMWVWLGILFSVLLYLAFAKRMMFESLAIGIVTVPMFLIAAGDRLASFALHTSRSASALLKAYWVFGIGSGEQIARIGAAANGWIADRFSIHLYGRLLLEGGVVHLLLFLLAAGFALQYAFTAMRNAQSKNAKTICGGVAAALLMFLVCGFALDVQTDLRILGFFWCICPAASMAKEMYGRTSS